MESQPLVNLAAPVDDAASLAGFIEALESIDSTTPLASLNETSIADNNGGRIML